MISQNQITFQTNLFHDVYLTTPLQIHIQQNTYFNENYIHFAACKGVYVSLTSNLAHHDMKSLKFLTIPQKLLNRTCCVHLSCVISKPCLILHAIT